MFTRSITVAFAAATIFCMVPTTQAAPRFDALPLLLAAENADEKNADPVERTDPEPTIEDQKVEGKQAFLGLSEEEFKALHELRTDQAPPAQGTMIPLLGGQAYLSLPKNATAPLPAVVMVHEWWGLNDHIKHWADRLANDGYAALAVDLYGGRVAKDPDTAMKLMQGVEDSTSLRILSAALQYLHEDPKIKAEKIGSIGWCFGGHWSLRTAILSPELDACVLYYGRPVTDVEQLKQIHAEVLGVFGNLDQSIPPPAVDEFEAALKQAGVKATILRFNAVHAFANPSNPKYDETSAAAAWKEVRSLFARTLKTK